MKRIKDKNGSWRQLTREESLEQDALYTLRDYSPVADANFSIEEFADMHNLSIERSAVVIANLEDDSVLEKIADGDYTTFDLYDRSQFNDAYSDMMADFVEEDECREKPDEEYTEAIVLIQGEIVRLRALGTDEESDDIVQLKRAIKLLMSNN